MQAYRTPAIKWQYQFTVGIDGYSYSFGDSSPMVTKEDAQAVLTYAVESNDRIPVNILSDLEGEIVSPGRFKGQVMFADDLPDGSDLDPDTKRMAEVTIVCSEVRKDTVFGE